MALGYHRRIHLPIPGFLPRGASKVTTKTPDELMMLADGGPVCVAWTQPDTF